MNGKDKVVAVLNDLLAGELAAIDQYFIHSRMYDNWGYSKLYQHIEHERMEETGHADQMIKRILFLDGTPDITRRDPLNVGQDVAQMLRNDLDVEYRVIKNLKAAIALCEQEQDYETREMLLKQLEDSEIDHAYWLEKQLGLIDRIGLQNYLQSKI